MAYFGFAASRNTSLCAGAGGAGNCRSRPREGPNRGGPTDFRCSWGAGVSHVGRQEMALHKGALRNLSKSQEIPRNPEQSQGAYGPKGFELSYWAREGPLAKQTNKQEHAASKRTSKQTHGPWLDATPSLGMASPMPGTVDAKVTLTFGLPFGNSISR